MADSPGPLAGLLRDLRRRARLTQQELAEAAGISLRAVSDLERGAATTPQKDTVRLLADGLHLVGPERVQFETAARGRPLEPASPAATAAAMRTLPRDTRSFTGRQRELDELVKTAATAGGVVAIHAIGGMAGVGKTAFAVHAAHGLADRYPGGQIFLPLHGHTPGQAPVDPADALASLLLSTGVPPGRVPPALLERSALWRDQAANTPLLLVLDDAASSDQVQPLLPGAGASLVLITSRRHLSALDDVTSVSLDTMPPQEAAALLVRLAGRAALVPGAPGVAELAEQCGYLPLAIGMAARQLRHHSAWTAAGLAKELTSARGRLGRLETEHLSVAAAFDLSYADLTEDQQRLFRRIGLHPGNEVDAYAAAALDGISLAAARHGLEALYDQYLLTEPAQGRYRPHDLIREHARTLARRLDPEADRDAAVTRLLDYYQHTAAAANAHIARRTRPEPDRAASRAPSMAAPVLDDQDDAMAWARTERANLLACLDYAAGGGHPARVVALTAGVSGLLQRDGPWADALTRHRTAARAGQELGDRLGQANALVDVGDIERWTNEYPAAMRALEEALHWYRELGDRLGQANALCLIGWIRQLTGDSPGAIRDLETALDLGRAVGDRRGQARALNHLGILWNGARDFPALARILEQALDIYRDLGDRFGQAAVLDSLGETRRMSGDYQGAARDLTEAFEFARGLGSRLGQASALSSLGDVRLRSGDYPAAVRDLEEALRQLRELGVHRGQGRVLIRLGIVRRLTGDYPAAALAVDEALGIFRAIGNRDAEAEALNARGAVHLAVGELAQARDCYQQSLNLSRETDSPWDEAHALAGLGRWARAAGDVAQAGSLLRQARAIFQRIGAAEAPELHAELDALAISDPTKGDTAAS